MAIDEHACSRCSTPIARGEIAAKTGNFWLCSACWKLWSVLRAKVVSRTLEVFVEEGRR